MTLTFILVFVLLALLLALALVFSKWPNWLKGFLAVAVTIQQQSGGNLAEILEGLAKVIRARFKLFRRVKAITAEAGAKPARSLYRFLLVPLSLTTDSTKVFQALQWGHLPSHFGLVPPQSLQLKRVLSLAMQG